MVDYDGEDLVPVDPNDILPSPSPSAQLCFSHYELAPSVAFVTGTAKPVGMRSRVWRVRVQYLNWYTRAIPCTRAAVLRVPTGIRLHYAGATTVNFSY